jgi:nucleotide-binding universal stress UspA family protein
MKIILAIDDLKSGAAAVEALFGLTPSKNIEVIVVHVLEPPSVLVGREMRSKHRELKTLWHESEQQAQETVDGAARLLRLYGFAVTSLIEHGDPKSRIIEIAERENADLIVLGSHGRKGVTRFLMGSVSEAMSRYAPCSVEIVRSRNAGSKREVS